MTVPHLAVSLPGLVLPTERLGSTLPHPPPPPPPPPALSLLLAVGGVRLQIRSALRQGDVTSAIEMANDLNPETLDTSPRLFFRLQLQRLIELIRGNKVTEALDFAESELAPLTDLHPDFLEELEETMALFAFEDQHASPLAHLLEPAQRHKVRVLYWDCHCHCHCPIDIGIGIGTDIVLHSSAARASLDTALHALCAVSSFLPP